MIKTPQKLDFFLSNFWGAGQVNLLTKVFSFLIWIPDEARDKAKDDS